MCFDKHSTNNFESKIISFLGKILTFNEAIIAVKIIGLVFNSSLNQICRERIFAIGANVLSLIVVSTTFVGSKYCHIKECTRSIVSKSPRDSLSRLA